MQSCSIEKRRHRKGYHVEWNKNISTKKFQKKSNNTFMKKEALKPTTIEQVKVFKEQKVLLNEQSKIKLEATKINANQIVSKSIEISIVSNKIAKHESIEQEILKPTFSIQSNKADKKKNKHNTGEPKSDGINKPKTKFFDTPLGGIVIIIGLFVSLALIALVISFIWPITFIETAIFIWEGLVIILAVATALYILAWIVGPIIYLFKKSKE